MFLVELFDGADAACEVLPHFPVPESYDDIARGLEIFVAEYVLGLLPGILMALTVDFHVDVGRDYAVSLVGSSGFALDPGVSDEGDAGGFESFAAEEEVSFCLGDSRRELLDFPGQRFSPVRRQRGVRFQAS